MDRSRSTSEVIDEERERSLKFVQSFLGGLGLLSLVAGLSVIGYRDELGLPPDSGWAVGVAFLSVGIVSTGMLFVWERIFRTSI